MKAGFPIWIASAILIVVSCTVSAAASPPATTTQAATQPAAAPTLGPPGGPSCLSGFWPELEWPTVCWLSAVAILALTIRVRPLLWLRNLDGLVLAGMCLLLALRHTAGGPRSGTHTWEWWSYLGLSLAALYWCVRGVGLLVSNRPSKHPGTVSDGVRLVLVLLGLALSIYQLAGAPLSPASRDALVGGLFTARHGVLPYGDAEGADSRSPLLYLVHAGAVRVVPPTLGSALQAGEQALTWDNRDWWQAEPWAESADLTPVRLVNAVLFVLTLVGLYVIGARLLTASAGWTLVALFCIFPGTLECLPRPDIMLPTVLLTWTLAFVLLPGGSLLAGISVVMAGIAWPWAWLALPLVIGYCWRRGWQAVGSTLGLLAGVALCAVGLVQLVAPALPHADGALKMAGFQPLYSADRAEGADDTVVVKRRDVGSEEIPAHAATRYFWRALVLHEETPLRRVESGAHAMQIDWPTGMEGPEVLYRQVQPAEAVLPLMQANYRAALAELSPAERALPGLRTVLEATWLATRADASASAGAWRLWGGPPPMESRWLLLRRTIKVATGLLVAWATLVIFVGGRARPRHLLGALLIATTGALAASEGGAVMDLVWVMPLIAALWAIHEPAPEPAAAPAARLTAAAPTLPSMVNLGDPPRITVEGEKG